MQQIYQVFILQIYLFHNGGPYHIETSPLICYANQNQWTGLYMIETSVITDSIHNIFINQHKCIQLQD